jgi:chromate transport protein ChrA
MRPGFQEILLIILIGLLVWAGFRFFKRNKGEDKPQAKKNTKATKKKQGG